MFKYDQQYTYAAEVCHRTIAVVGRYAGCMSCAGVKRCDTRCWYVVHRAAAG